MRWFGLRDAPQIELMRGYHGSLTQIAVTFQSSERTLSEEDATRLRKAVVDALAARFGAELRA